MKDFDEIKFLEAHQEFKEITSIRINPNKIFSNDINELNNLYNLNISKPIPWCEHGYYLKERPKFTLDPLLHAGAYYVQEPSSMFLWHILQQLFNKESTPKVLDVCAAPGGKSTLLSSYFANGLIVSNEVIKQRANVLVENITKWGASNCIVTNNDPKDFKEIENFFDLVVIDAPCSGSGLFRKDASAIDEWSIDNVNLCHQRQKRILSDTIHCLNNDGIIIYSTCSYSTQENEEILDWVMEEFDVESIQINMHENWGIVETQSQYNNAFGYRFFPDKVKGEGFFITVLKTKKETKKKNFKKNNFPLPSKIEMQVVEKYINHSNNCLFFKHNENIIYFLSTFYIDLQILSSYLYIKMAGTEIGLIKGKDLIPSHNLALSNLKIKNFSTIELNIEDVLQYLSKKVVTINAECRGWALILYKDCNIGWVKVLENRINNYYPTNWRILNLVK